MATPTSRPGAGGLTIPGADNNSGAFGLLGGILGAIFGAGGGGGGHISPGFTSGGIADVGYSDLGSGGSLGGPAIGGGVYEYVQPMAAGGIVRKPTLALIGEQGPEAVVPLHRAAQMGGAGGITVHVTVNGVGMSPAQVAAAAGAAAESTTLRVLTETSAGRSAVKRAAHRGL